MPGANVIVNSGFREYGIVTPSWRGFHPEAPQAEFGKSWADYAPIVSSLQDFCGERAPVAHFFDKSEPGSPLVLCSRVHYLTHTSVIILLFTYTDRMPLVTLIMAFWMQQPASVEDAVRLLDNGQLTEAREAISQLDPAAPRVAHTAGVLYFRLHDYAKSIEALTRAAQTEAPASLEYRQSTFFLGQSCFLLARMPEAISWLEKA